MFNENSAQPDVTAGGSEIQAEANPQTVTGGEEHEVGAGGGLPWYFASKFAFRNNKSGVGRHLAPQESYVQDVLREGLTQAARYVPAEGSEELGLLEREVNATRDLIEIRNDFDIDDDSTLEVKMEGKDPIRSLRARFLLALKIAGANHVDRMYRIEHAQLNDWDINRTTEHKSFITSGAIRDKWARKAGYYGSVLDAIDDLVVAAEINLNLEGGIRQALYQDAREVSQNLSAPKPVVKPGEEIAKSDLSAMAA